MEQVIKIIKYDKTKAIAIRSGWSWYIVWIPTIVTEYHPKEESVLSNFNIEDKFEAKGSCFTINIMAFIWTITIDYWWNLTEKK